MHTSIYVQSSHIAHSVYSIDRGHMVAEPSRGQLNRDLLSVVVVVFFTLTDRASTIPSNIRGCQSGTWSAGQKKIRGTSTKLQ